MLSAPPVPRRAVRLGARLRRAQGRRGMTRCSTAAARTRQRNCWPQPGGGSKAGANRPDRRSSRRRRKPASPRTAALRTTGAAQAIPEMVRRTHFMRPSHRRAIYLRPNHVGPCRGRTRRHSPRRARRLPPHLLNNPGRRTITPIASCPPAAAHPRDHRPISRRTANRRGPCVRRQFPRRCPHLTERHLLLRIRARRVRGPCRPRTTGASTTMVVQLAHRHIPSTSLPVYRGHPG